MACAALLRTRRCCGGYGWHHVVLHGGRKASYERQLAFNARHTQAHSDCLRRRARSSLTLCWRTALLQMLQMWVCP